MTEKVLKSLKGKKFTGVLASPIETGLVMPVVGDTDAWRKYEIAKIQALGVARFQKIDALAEHLGVGDRKEIGGEFYLISIISELASETVPGFQEKKRGKWSRDLLVPILAAVDFGKAKGQFENDLDACRAYLMTERPELAKRSNKPLLVAEAKQLRNRITGLRSAMEKAERQLHKKPHLKIVKR